MVDFLIALPTWLGCGIAMVSTAAVGFVVYVISNKLISMYQIHELQEPTSILFRVVGMLVSLMLALAFSEVISDLKTIRDAIQREKVAISDIFEVLKMFDVEKTREIRTIVIEYTKAVIDDEWPALANHRLSQRVGSLKKRLSLGVLNLRPENPIQEKLLSNLIADVDSLSDYRVIRLDGAMGTPPIYLYVIIFGFLVTMAFFGVYRQQAPLIVLISLYTIFVGLVVYLVLQLSQPFDGDIGITPTSLEFLLETMQSEIS